MDDVMLKVQLVAEIVELQSASEPSKQPFTALVTYAGKPSDGFVGGTEGIKGGPYHVRIPIELLKKKIKSLAGKRVFASSELNSHKNSKYVGQFVDAWCEEVADGIVAGKASGYLLRDADPDLVSEIIDKSRQKKMGFSYDLKDVRFELAASGDDSTSQCIDLTDFQWRGATILERDAAAYLETELAAQKSKSQIPNNEGEDDMTKEEIMAAVAAGMQPVMTKFQSDVVDPLKAELTASISAVQKEVTDLRGKQTALEASLSGKPATEPKKDDDKKPATPATSGTRIAATDFTAAILDGITAGLKPLQESITQLKESLTVAKADPKAGFRKTLSAQDVQVLTKYGELDDAAEPTVDNYRNAILMIQADGHLSKEQKGRMITDLRAQKNFLIRSGNTGVN